MNTTLTPGVRKLPSALDIQILNTLRNPQPINSTAITSLTAPLSAGALIAINNGSFDTNTDWYTRGDSHILNGQAILSENSPYLSHLSQTFVIPQGAKALQFTLVNTDLKTNNTALAPNDAFEIALLNHNTNTSVLTPLSGLSQTDALLNIQTNGQTYFSNAVTLVGATTSGNTLNLKTPRTVQIDVSTLTPGTIVTLYFDLLGFGAQNSTITIDDVQILSEQSQAPITQNDSATLNQNTSTALNILDNDTDPDGTLNPSTLLIAQAPQHGQLSINANGTVTYQPANNYIGTDQFTYLIQDNSGVYSNPATVNITILNPIPTINQVNIDSTLTEGTPAQLSASATISGNQLLTYNWTLGDGTTTTGQTIQHTYKDNGTYTVTLAVNSNNGPTATTQRTLTITNLAPTVNIGSDQTSNEGQSTTFNGTYTDPGILDTHTLQWNFGDGTTQTGTLIPTHIYADNGIYTVTLTVTDNDGATTTDNLVVTVNNIAPTINNLTGPVTLNEGQTATFSATATDPGTLDTLAYTWTFNDGTPTVTGPSVTHTFSDNGSYPVVLTVTDKDGASTTQTLNVQVANVAPTVDAGADKTSNEGQPIQLSGSYTDPGILDTQTISWNFGDGSAPTIGTLTPTHIYKDNGTYTIGLTVTDKDGGRTTDTLVVTVANVAPTITNLTGPVTLNEGQSATFSATATDPGSIDTLTYTWTFNDRTPTITGQSVTHTFADNGSYPVVLTVTDKDGATTTQTLTVQVANIAPTPTGVTISSTLKEGQPTTFSASATDPGVNDTLTYTWNFGDNTIPVTGQNVQHTYVDNGSYTIALTVTDNNGGTTTRTFPITVANLPPILSSLTVPNTLTEGQNGTFSATATDPGNDTLTYTWTFGDSTPSLTGQTIQHIYKDNGTYTATLLITDKDGATTTHTFAINVSNIAPTVTLSPISPTTTGTPITLNATLTDPGILDTHTLLWNFGDNTSTSGTLTPTHTYTQPGSYTITLTAIDKDGGLTTATTTLNINPAVLPTLTIDDLTVTEGDTGTTTATFTLTLSAPSTQPITVAYSTANGTAIAGSDYTATSGTLTFTPGQTSQTISIAILGDKLTEPNETLFLNLSNATNAAIADNQGQLAITDNDGTTNPGTNTFAIRTEGTFTMNGSGDLDGDPLILSDDALVYAAKGYTINGNPTLPVQRDGAGNILKDSSGKPILIPNAIVVSPGYTTANGPTNKYAGLSPVTSIPLQPIALPTYSDLKTQTLNSLVPTGTTEVLFNASLNPINSIADWNSKFPASGTTAQPKVVRVTNGGLNIPSNATLNNIVIIVDNGDINFNGSGHTANNVILIANNGNLNLNTINATNLRVFASGAVNMNGAAKFNGSYNLIATGTTSGHVTFNGSTNSTTGTDQIRVFAGGNITFNGSSNTRGSFTGAGTFTFNGSSTLYGSIATKGNITFNGSATVFGAPINETLPNLAPTNLTLSTSSITENTANNTVVGTFSTTDQNTNDVHTYQLVTGTGSTDNAAFTVVGNQLILNTSANYEAKSSYSIRVRTTDQAGGTFEKVFSIGITDVNEAPTAIALSATTLSENNPSGVVVGTLSATDPDVNDTKTFQLVTGTGGIDNALFSIVNNQLVFNAVADYETKASYSVRVRVSDRAGLFSEQVFFINVNDVNEVPIDLVLSQMYVLENNALNTLIGIFSTIDRNSTFTYQLVSGVGSVDNNLFTIQGNELHLAEQSDFETKSSYSIRVRVTDPLGLSREEVLTISVLDQDELPLFFSLV
jgi:PKD repeat protein